MNFEIWVFFPLGINYLYMSPINSFWLKENSIDNTLDKNVKNISGPDKKWPSHRFATIIL